MTLARLACGGIVIAFAVALFKCGGSSTPTSSDASAGGSAGAGGNGGSGGATMCSGACGAGRKCCGGVCVNPDNDPTNCGGCGVTCGGATPYCDGSCKPAPCSTTCGTGNQCCGTTCCATGQLCCKSEGPVAGGETCFTPTPSSPTCPVGCAPMCVSDRDLKRDIEPIDGDGERAILESLAPEPSADPIDAHGAAFASIKALYAKTLEQSRRIERLERDNEKLRARGRTRACAKDESE